MSAADTTLRVLTWAAAEEMSQDGAAAVEVPHGGLAAAAELAAPQAELRAAVGRLAAVAAARLRLASPPLGDARPPGLAACLLAAAVGARSSPAAAQRPLDAAGQCPAPTAYDLVACHAVVRHALRAGPLDADMAEQLAALSPLTAVLDHPPGSASSAAMDLLRYCLLPHRDGHDLAVRVFAEPAASAAQAAWRADALSRCRRHHLGFVLDVYETGLTLFGPEHRRRLRQAQALLGSTPDLAAARPLVQWWRALAEIERARPEEIRGRYLITAAYVEGVRTYWWFAARQAAALSAVPAPRAGRSA